MRSEVDEHFRWLYVARVCGHARQVAVAHVPLLLVDVRQELAEIGLSEAFIEEIEADIRRELDPSALPDHPELDSRRLTTAFRFMDKWYF
jgi:hypothetical protein